MSQDKDLYRTEEKLTEFVRQLVCINNLENRKMISMYFRHIYEYFNENRGNYYFPRELNREYHLIGLNSDVKRLLVYNFFSLFDIDFDYDGSILFANDDCIREFLMTFDAYMFGA